MVWSVLVLRFVSCLAVEVLRKKVWLLKIRRVEGDYCVTIIVKDY